MAAPPSFNRWTKQSQDKLSDLFKYVPVDYMIISELYIGIGEGGQGCSVEKTNDKTLLALQSQITP